MYYGEEQRKLGLSEFSDTVLQNINRLIVFELYIEENFSFFEAVLFKIYERYVSSNTDFSINEATRLLEIFLDSLFKFKPDNSLPEDKITIY